MKEKIINLVRKAIAHGTKWTLSADENNDSMSADKLKFTPYELISGLNATNFQNALLEINGCIRGDITTGNPEMDKALRYKGVAVRSVSLLRAACVACALMKATNGRPTNKLLKSWTKEAQDAILATDNIADELKEKQNAYNALKRKSERLALLGYLNRSNAEMENATVAMKELATDIADLKEDKAEAVRRENAVSVALVKSVWLKEDEDENETKTENK